jgi:hypothetical protein
MGEGYNASKWNTAHPFATANSTDDSRAPIPLNLNENTAVPRRVVILKPTFTPLGI